MNDSSHKISFQIIFDHANISMINVYKKAKHQDIVHLEIEKRFIGR
jgi:hypothetical protein